MLTRNTLLLSCLLTLAGPAAAQLRLPQLPLQIQTPRLDTLTRPAERLLSNTLDELRSVRMNDLLRRHPDVLELDPRGQLAVRHEVLAWPAGGVLSVQRAPAGMDTSVYLEQLRAADPQGVYDYNHIYSGSSASALGARHSGSRATEAADSGGGGLAAAGGGYGGSATAGGGGPMAAGGGGGRSTAAGGPAAAGGGSGAPRRAIAIGLVDSGIDAKHEVFSDTRIEHWGCEGKSHPAPHGTGVAALMAGQSARFHGVLEGATLYAADVYCDAPTGGSVKRIAGALAWLSKHDVTVINISLVGPPNLALERVVKNMLQHGHILVAAVGNDGPAAAPLYPASYPGVVGVSGVDRQGRVLPEAARGPQVMFAAPGSQMVSASTGNTPFTQVRGTSYAAPIVAALLAGMLEHGNAAAIRTLGQQAAGAEANVTGLGVVGSAYRSEPSQYR